MNEGATQGIELGVEGSRLPIPEAAEDRPIGVRDFKITKRILTKHGYTPECPGCEASLSREHASHTLDLEACCWHNAPMIMQEQDRRGHHTGDPRRLDTVEPTQALALVLEQL